MTRLARMTSLLFFGFIVVTTLTVASASSTFTSLFLPTGNMTQPRYLHGSAALSDGTALVVGGCSSGPCPMNTAERFNPLTGTFAPTGSMSQGRRLATTTVLADGKVLVAGGLNSPNTAEVYDPTTSNFSPTAGSMVTSRYEFHSAALLSNGKVLVAGGYNGSYLSAAEL